MRSLSHFPVWTLVLVLMVMMSQSSVESISSCTRFAEVPRSHPTIKPSMTQGSKLYYIHKQSFTDINTAHRLCSNEGGKLAEIMDSKEYKSISEYLASVLPNNYSVYIGGRDAAKEGRWVLPSTGQPLPYTHWFSVAHALNDKVANCLVISHKDEEGWVMVPDFCDLSRYFYGKPADGIPRKYFGCEQDGSKGLLDSDNDGFHPTLKPFLSQDTTLYYIHEQRFSDIGKSRDRCSAEGGTLAQIKDSSEFYFVNNYLDSIFPGDPAVHVYIDGTDEAEEGKWVFHSTGQPLPYPRWCPVYGQNDRWVNCLTMNYRIAWGWKMCPYFCVLPNYDWLQNMRFYSMCEQKWSKGLITRRCIA